MADEEMKPERRGKIERNEGDWNSQASELRMEKSAEKWGPGGKAP